MSRTRQPRPNNEQNDEEKRLWTQIKEEAKKIDALIARSGEIGNEIVTIEKQQAAQVDAGNSSEAALDEKLEALYRENVRISEQISHMIEGQGSNMPLLDSISILQALREESGRGSTPLPTTGRSASNNGNKPRLVAMGKRKAPTADDEDASAAPSPRVSSGRLGPGAARRGGSAAPSLREASVKLEDGAESVTSGDGQPSKASSDAGAKMPTPVTPTAGQRAALTEGAMVFYRHKGRQQEGEGILCRVTSVIGEGKQRRYEIQDADNDSETLTPYRASVNNLIPIPTSMAGLADIGKGKSVLAQYPDTTTFYKAEVVTAWRAKDGGGAKEGKEYVRLRFEGDFDDKQEPKEMSVDRKLVIPDLK